MEMQGQVSTSATKVLKFQCSGCFGILRSLLKESSALMLRNVVQALCLSSLTVEPTAPRLFPASRFGFLGVDLPRQAIGLPNCKAPCEGSPSQRSRRPRKR